MRKRSFFVWAAIVAASLIAIISSLTTWVDRQMLDEDSWRKASAELIQDPDVRQAVSVYLVNEVYEKVDVAADLEQRLPPDSAAGRPRRPVRSAAPRPMPSSACSPRRACRRSGSTRARSRRRSSSTCWKTRRARGSPPATARSRSTSASS